MEAVAQNLERMKAYHISHLPTGAKFYFVKDAKKRVYVVDEPAQKKWKFKGKSFTNNLVKCHLKEQPWTKEETKDTTLIIFLNY